LLILLIFVNFCYQLSQCSPRPSLPSTLQQVLDHAQQRVSVLPLARQHLVLQGTRSSSSFLADKTLPSPLHRPSIAAYIFLATAPLHYTSTFLCPPFTPSWDLHPPGTSLLPPVSFVSAVSSTITLPCSTPTPPNLYLGSSFYAFLISSSLTPSLSFTLGKGFRHHAPNPSRQSFQLRCAKLFESGNLSKVLNLLLLPLSRPHSRHNSASHFSCAPYSFLHCT
jgi:hypothetical protein